MSDCKKMQGQSGNTPPQPATDGAFPAPASALPTPVDLAAAYAGATLLVTGAGGTIGAELCRQLLDCRPRCLILLEQSEAALYTIEKELHRICAATGRLTEIRPVLGSAGDRRAVDAVLTGAATGVIFHAAAFKHVHLVEQNPAAGVENNIFTTRTLAEAAQSAGVPHFVLVSTDKAVRPTGVMGATKRLAEIVVQDLARRSVTTRFAIVRFGNVFGSSGSVVPLFREQIEQGGPVTLTDEAATRYFMSLVEAARLVLTIGALREPPGSGADVFVQDMGRPVRIRDLALAMIRAAGHSHRTPQNPAGDIAIKMIGLRPGEKLHEDLLAGPARPAAFHPLVLRAAEPGLSEFETAQALKALRLALGAGDPGDLRDLLLRWAAPSQADPLRAEA